MAQLPYDPSKISRELARHYIPASEKDIAEMLAAIGAIGRFVAEIPDEYLRMLEVRKIIVATGVTLAITSVWGLLELYSDTLPRLPVFYVFPIWCGGLFVGQLVNRFAFGDEGDCP